MEFLAMAKPIESNDKTQMDFQHPLPCAPFLEWAIFYRLKMQRCCYRCAYEPPFPDWMHLGFPYVKRSYWLSVALGCFHLRGMELLFHKKLAPKAFPCPHTHLLAPREGHMKVIPGTPKLPEGIPGLLVTRGLLQSQSSAHTHQGWPVGDKSLPKSVLLEVASKATHLGLSQGQHLIIGPHLHPG